MADTRAYIVNNFLMLLMLGTLVNCGMVHADQRSANSHITPSKELLQIIALNSKKGKKSAKNRGKIKRMCAAAKNILQAPVNFVFGKKPSGAKKTFYALLGMTILASVGYGCYEYWPMIEALWKEQQEGSDAQNDVVGQDEKGDSSDQTLLPPVNQSTSVIQEKEEPEDQPKTNIDPATSNNNLEKKDTSPIQTPVVSTEQNRNSATSAPVPVPVKENAPKALNGHQSHAQQQHAQAPLPQQNDSKKIINEQVVQGGQVNTREDSSYIDREKVKEDLQWVREKVGKFIEWGMARKSHFADQSQSQDLQVQNKKIDEPKKTEQQSKKPEGNFAKSDSQTKESIVSVARGEEAIQIPQQVLVENFDEKIKIFREMQCRNLEYEEYEKFYALRDELRAAGVF